MDVPAEEISRQSSVDRVMWLLVITLTQTYNEEGQAGQRETHSGQLEEKRSTREFNVGAKSSASGV